MLVTFGLSGQLKMPCPVMEASNKDRPPPALPHKSAVKLRKGDPEKKPDPDSEEAKGFWTESARRQYMVLQFRVTEKNGENLPLT